MAKHGAAIAEIKHLERKLTSFIRNDEGKISPAAVRFVSLLALDGEVKDDTARLIGSPEIVKKLRIKADDIKLTVRGVVSKETSIRLSDLLLNNTTLNPFLTYENPGAGTMGQDIFDTIARQSREIRGSAVSASR
ncbi:MAG: hypothetical protein AABY33_08215 [Pseudomonadota bacterium]